MARTERVEPMATMLGRIFRRGRQRDALAPLYAAVVARARDPGWYREGAVPDTQDGRFDMIAAILSLVLLRLEADEARAAESAMLAELFVDDMDAQLRQIGIGDVVVGKHVGRMMGALGGRLGAYRAALEGGDLEPALARNLYRDGPPAEAELRYTAGRLKAFHAALSGSEAETILTGALPELE